MNDDSKKLKEIIDQYPGILFCGAIIHKDGTVTDKTGDFTLFGGQGLSSAVLGPYGSPQGSFEMVSQFGNDRKMLPRMMSQGNQFALLEQPRMDVVVVLFGRKVSDFSEHLKLRKKISAAVLEYFQDL